VPVSETTWTGGDTPALTRLRLEPGVRYGPRWTYRE